ncbi:molybdopterin oxidoreductase family protein [Paradesulfitobacterium ferrireducens]|uniref:molybdopterin oxidoreductase family protein n=1 Tax=Paradesulfitobacterium ferrireducens TaxID=2816476 RepID=UPI001A8E1EC6|nr:nitrate reductase [Paradesulfitobacterium ferrireducens]
MSSILKQAIESFFTSDSPAAAETPDEWVYSTCGYCSVGCGLYIGTKDGRAVAVKGNKEYPVNQGRLCIKGLYEWKVLHHPERAAVPLIRRESDLAPGTWEQAFGLMTGKIKENLRAYGPESIGIYHTGQLLLEEYYALGKLGKGVLGTPNFDANTRLCMASTVEGYIRSFGADGPPGCYDDLDQAKLIFIFGSNPAEMHPQLWQRIMRSREQNAAKIIVADPRLTLAAQVADLHLRLRPGTNVPLLNSMAYVLMEEGLTDPAYIAAHVSGYEELRALVQHYPPERAEALTGVKAEMIVEAARMFGRASAATTFFCQGVNQSMSATDSVTLINNLHLITGKIGKPGSAPFSLTGQATAMSTREVGAGRYLPGFRNPQNPAHRREVADFWGVKENRLPYKTTDIMQILKLIEEDKLKVLWVIGTNPAVSLPDQGYVRALLDKVFLIVQDVYYPMETAKYADIFLPAAQWGEKTGTYTNSERRVNVGYKAVEPPGEAKADLDIFKEVGKRLGAGRMFSWSSSEEVFAEWAALSRGRPNDMSGMTYKRMEQEGGLQWPCPELGHQGTARLYSEGNFPTWEGESQAYGPNNNDEGRARLWAVDYSAPPEVPDAEYPFWLNTGRIIEHYHTRTKTKRVPELSALAKQGFAVLNPEDAARLSLAEGDRVKITTRRGWIEVKAVINNSVAPGQVFVPFHFGDLDPGEEHLHQAANHLTLNWVDPISQQPISKIAACRIEKGSLKN